MDLAHFRTAVLLYPIASVVHVAEEWPRFPRWVRRFGSSRYSDRAYVVTHAWTIGISIASAIVVTMFPRSAVVLAFMAFAFGPAVACNAVFHLGASVASRTYCAGAVSSALVYVPLSALVAVSALDAHLVAGWSLAAALAVAAAVHALEVGRNVFGLW